MSARGVPEQQEAGADCVDIHIPIPSRFSEKGFDGLDYCCFRGSVGLVLVRAADRVTHSPAGTELFECPRGTLGSPIRCQLYWNAFFRHPFLQQAHDLGPCGCAATGADSGPAREAVGVHQKVVARQLEDVRGSTLERAGWRRFDQEGPPGCWREDILRTPRNYGPHCEYRL